MERRRREDSRAQVNSGQGVRLRRGVSSPWLFGFNNRSSAAAETELAKIAKRATTVFMCKPGLRDCGANIVASVIGPKVVYLLAFAKAQKKAVETIESGYGNMIRRSIGVAQGFPWEVLSGSPEFDGLGALRLTTEVTKARLHQSQPLISSTYDSEPALPWGCCGWHNGGVGSATQ